MGKKWKEKMVGERDRTPNREREGYKERNREKGLGIRKWKRQIAFRLN